MLVSDFIHPKDAEALRQLESIPVLPTVVKKFLAIGYERNQYGLNLATNIRLSERQLPELYRHLPEICNLLGIEEPEFYLNMSPVPNAWTSGATRIYITMTSGLVDLLSPEELHAVIAHECGHIFCQHVLYHSLANYIAAILTGTISGLIGDLASLVTAPLQYALLYWMRQSELSCDRVASIATSPEIVANVMARLAGGSLSITKDLNYEAWTEQAQQYEDLLANNKWDKTLLMLSTLSQSHPFMAVRVNEILKWAQTDQYERLVNNLKIEESPLRCPKCGAGIKPDWSFCRSCGTPISK